MSKFKVEEVNPWPDVWTARSRQFREGYDRMTWCEHEWIEKEDRTGHWWECTKCKRWQLERPNVD